MIFGYNTDVKSGDMVYHVQTEDRGDKNPVIDSVIYVKGRIVDRKRTPYVPGEQTAEKLQEMVKQQHRELVDTIRSGNYVIPEGDSHTAAHSTAAVAAATAAAPIPEIELTNPKEVERGGALVFQLRVHDRHTGKPLAGAAVEAVLAPGGAEVKQHTTAGVDGTAEIRFDLPRAEGETVLFRAVSGQAADIIKFRLAHAG